MDSGSGVCSMKHEILVLTRVPVSKTFSGTNCVEYRQQYIYVSRWIQDY